MLQKISPILPSSPRITSVDMSAERPVRPGSADFGLPVGEHSGSGDRSLSAMERVNILKETQRVNAENMGESAKSINQRANKEFFEEHGSALEVEHAENIPAAGSNRATYRPHGGSSMAPSSRSTVSIKA